MSGRGGGGGGGGGGDEEVGVLGDRPTGQEEVPTQHAGTGGRGRVSTGLA